MGPKLSVLTGFVVSLALISSTASANWQYTQWGMSPEQVVAASQGAAHLEQDNGAALPHVKALLLAKGQIQIDNFDFIVGFYFDGNRRLLKSVFLRLEKCSENDAGRLKELLNAKYGAPRQILSPYQKWVSPFAPDMITFISPTVRSRFCSIEYEPIPAGL